MPSGIGPSWNVSIGCAWSCSSKSLLKRRLISSDDGRAYFPRREVRQHYPKPKHCGCAIPSIPDFRLYVSGALVNHELRGPNHCLERRGPGSRETRGSRCVAAVRVECRLARGMFVEMLGATSLLPFPFNALKGAVTCGVGGRNSSSSLASTRDAFFKGEPAVTGVDGGLMAGTGSLGS